MSERKWGVGSHLSCTRLQPQKHSSGATADVVVAPASTLVAAAADPSSASSPKQGRRPSKSKSPLAQVTVVRRGSKSPVPRTGPGRVDVGSKDIFDAVPVVDVETGSASNATSSKNKKIEVNKPKPSRVLAAFGGKGAANYTMVPTGLLRRQAKEKKEQTPPTSDVKMGEVL